MGIGFLIFKKHLISGDTGIKNIRPKIKFYLHLILDLLYLLKFFGVNKCLLAQYLIRDTVHFLSFGEMKNEKMKNTKGLFPTKDMKYLPVRDEVVI